MKLGLQHTAVRHGRSNIDTISIENVTHYKEWFIPHNEISEENSIEKVASEYSKRMYQKYILMS